MESLGSFGPYDRFGKHDDDSGCTRPSGFAAGMGDPTTIGSELYERKADKLFPTRGVASSVLDTNIVAAVQPPRRNHPIENDRLDDKMVLE